MAGSPMITYYSHVKHKERKLMVFGIMYEFPDFKYITVVTIKWIVTAGLALTR